MKLRIEPTIYNNARTRKQALKEVRKPIKDSLVTKAKKKLFKVKHVDNDVLFNNPENPNRNIGGHYTLTVGINPQTDDVAVAIITSLEDRDGNPTKQEQIRNGLILPFNNSRGLNKISGLKQDVLVENPYTGDKINYSSLQDPSREIEIGAFEEEVAKFLFDNEQHTYKSHRKGVRTQNYIRLNKK